MWGRAMVSPEGSTEEQKDSLSSSLTHMLIVRIQSLVVFEGLNALLVVGWRSPSVHFHMDLCTGPLATGQLGPSK